MSKIAIIGAGLSGLTAAHQLKHIAQVKLFDKSRGVGGRMSTRYAGDYEFDHGAQYFTARDPRFQAAVEAAIEQGVVAPWDGRAVYKKDGAMIADTGGDRFVGTPRMNSWPKALAEGLDITLGARVSKLKRDSKKWTLIFEDGQEEGGFDRVICAVPSVHAIDLLPNEFSGMAALKATKMEACFALMVGWVGHHDFGWDTLRVNNDVNAWLAVNSAKPDRSKSVTTLMVHAAPDWSNEHADADRAWVQAQMETSASALCGLDVSKAPHLSLHRWLYASVSKSPEQGALYDPALGLAACGDWCLGGRVEGAYLSGLAAAEAVSLRL
ncbi:FAD-dependent oxidoreductase [Hellea sp.]|nr:FAD-dependent oxidoreductase [Hellea sp.]